MRKKNNVKPCPVCGCDMLIEKKKKGGGFKQSKVYWSCSERYCNHKELEESTRESYIREGSLD